MKNLSFAGLLIFLSISNSSCQSWKKFNLYSIDDDKKLGLSVSKEIAANPAQYPLLPEQGNEEVYKFVRALKDDILNSGRVKNKNVFAWEVKIIKDDKTMNAFCTPGGYIYVYTGLIKYLDNEDELAGVMGHEIAHADMRHSTRQLTKIMPLAVIGEVLSAGNKNKQAIKDLTTSLIALSFSRDSEREADKYSVFYLCNSGHNAAGSAGFFKKIKGKGSPPVFMSTHPDPGNRVKDIEELAKKLNCSTYSENSTANYQKIKSLL